jgi:hypothetical protein
MDGATWFPVLEANQGTITLLALFLALSVALWEHHQGRIAREDAQTAGMEDALHRLLSLISALRMNSDRNHLRAICLTEAADLRASLAAGQQKFGFAHRVRATLSLLEQLAVALEQETSQEERLMWRDKCLDEARLQMFVLGSRGIKRNRDQWEVFTDKAPLRAPRRGGSAFARP